MASIELRIDRRNGEMEIFSGNKIPEEGSLDFDALQEIYREIRSLVRGFEYRHGIVVGGKLGITYTPKKTD